MDDSGEGARSPRCGRSAMWPRRKDRRGVRTQLDAHSTIQGVQEVAWFRGAKIAMPRNVSKFLRERLRYRLVHGGGVTLNERSAPWRSYESYAATQSLAEHDGELVG